MSKESDDPAIDGPVSPASPASASRLQSRATIKIARSDVKERAPPASTRTLRPLSRRNFVDITKMLEDGDIGSHESPRTNHTEVKEQSKLDDNALKDNQTKTSHDFGVASEIENEFTVVPFGSSKIGGRIKPRGLDTVEEVAETTIVEEMTKAPGDKSVNVFNKIGGEDTQDDNEYDDEDFMTWVQAQRAEPISKNISEGDLFFSLRKLTWGDAARQCRERGIPLADAIIQQGHDPRQYDYNHIMDDTSALENNPDKWEEVFAGLDAAKQLQEDTVQKRLPTIEEEPPSMPVKRRMTVQSAPRSQKKSRHDIGQSLDKQRLEMIETCIRRAASKLWVEERLNDVLFSSAAKTPKEYEEWVGSIGKRIDDAELKATGGMHLAKARAKLYEQHIDQAKEVARIHEEDMHIIRLLRDDLAPLLQMAQDD